MAVRRRCYSLYPVHANVDTVTRTYDLSKYDTWTPAFIVNGCLTL
jgi:hypothetical protein